MTFGMKSVEIRDISPGRGHQTEPVQNRHRQFGTAVTVRNRDKVRRFRRAGSGLQKMKNRNRQFKTGGLPVPAAFSGGRRRGA